MQIPGIIAFWVAAGVIRIMIVMKSKSTRSAAPPPSQS